LHFVHLFEQGCRGDEGMTIGYARADGTVTPLVKQDGPDRQAEQWGQPAIAHIQKGVLACADAWRQREAHADRARLEKLRDEVQDRVLRFIFVPTTKEREAMAQLTWSEDLTTTVFDSLLPSSVGLLQPSRWLRGFYDSAWKPAYLTRTGGPGLGWAFRWYEEVKLRFGRK
jgi:hypothetical protein